MNINRILTDNKSRRMIAMPMKWLCATFVVLHFSAFTSCSSEVDDYFSEPASKRLANTMEKAAQILQSAEYGWEFEYYPGAALEYGGIIYIVKFDKQQATVGCSLIPDSTYTSYYKLTNDNGPVLSFDTYNPLLHYFATPSSEEYEAKGGDFEFVIDNITDDVISLYGKKTRNTMFLRRLKTSPDGYARKTVDVFDHFADSIHGNIGTATVHGKCNPVNRTISMSAGSSTFSVHYAYTDRGIRLYRPLQIGGVSVQDFNYDTATSLLTCTDAEGVQLQGTPYATDFMSYPLYEADYTLNYDNGPVDVHLKPNRLEGTYLLQGLSRKYDLVLHYDTATGNLLLGSQVVGQTDDGRVIYWACYDYDGGGTALADEGQFTIKWNKNRFYPRFDVKATNPNILNCSGGLLIYLYTNADGNLTAGLIDEPAWLTNGSMQFRNIVSLNRKTRIQ